MAFTIRELLPEDRPGWEHLWGGYLDFYQAPMESVVIEVTWSRLLDPNEPMMGLIAKDAGTHELIGLAHCVFHRGTWSIGEFCYLEDLFVVPNARKQGVGRALIETVYARADARKCERVYWLTHETNTAARQLYDQVAENRGFIQYRRP
jgi:GNAT superfamily N-acetyltransferase